MNRKLFIKQMKFEGFMKGIAEKKGGQLSECELSTGQEQEKT